MLNCKQYHIKVSKSDLIKAHRACKIWGHCRITFAIIVFPQHLSGSRSGRSSPPPGTIPPGATPFQPGRSSPPPGTIPPGAGVSRLCSLNVMPEGHFVSQQTTEIVRVSIHGCLNNCASNFPWKNWHFLLQEFRGRWKTAGLTEQWLHCIENGRSLV